VPSDFEPIKIRGRGAGYNPPNRFETLAYVPDPNDDECEDSRGLQTVLLRDASRTLITYNDSPDVGFDASINPYRGCEHGCIYCYARPSHEYLGFSAGLDFETKILVKEDAPELLRRDMSSKSWKPQVVAISGVTDPYQPVEKKLQLTRRCIEVFAEFRNPVMLVTKNNLISRDVDLLSEMARSNAAAAFISVTTLDENLARIMEPRASTPARRLAAIEALASAGVPVGVLTAPIVPGLTDHEINSIISAAVQAGARFAGYTIMRLPYAVAPLFEEWLTRHFPDRKKKVLSHIKSLRGGKLNDPQFNSRMRGEGAYAEQIRGMFAIACKRAGIEGKRAALSTDSFRRPFEGQYSLFDNL